MQPEEVFENNQGFETAPPFSVWDRIGRHGSYQKLCLLQPCSASAELRATACPAPCRSVPGPLNSTRIATPLGEDGPSFPTDPEGWGPDDTFMDVLDRAA